MVIKDYGVWVAYPISFFAETDPKDPTPHLQLRFDENKNASEGSIRAAVNIKSSTKEESRLVYWFYRNFQHPITEDLAALRPGFHPRSKDVPGLDYIRGNILNIKDGAILKHNVPGEKNDIIDFISPVLTQAINEKATIYIYGEPFSRGEQGIHNVHMNQGNEGRFKQFNGVYQDGGILLQFPDGHWEAIFLAFGVQKVHTDDETGHPIGDEDFVDVLEGPPRPFPDATPTDPPPKKPIQVEELVFIRAALLNPVGPDQEPTGRGETVYLHNRSLHAIDVTRYSIVNRAGKQQNLVGFVDAASSKGFAVPDAPLSNRGGTITLLNSNGLKVDGVSYTKEQAQREGDLLYFH